MITSDFTCGAVLITFGALLGKVSRLQLLIIGIVECIFFAVNEQIAVNILKVGYKFFLNNEIYTLQLFVLVVYTTDTKRYAKGTTCTF